MSLCMRGRIYSDQKCPICFSTFKHQDSKRGLFCPNHPDQRAHKRFIVRFGRKVQKRFSNYLEAERFLDGLRYEVDKGTFDYRDYLGSNPLSFTILSDKWLEIKEKQVKPGTYKHFQTYIKTAQNYFQNTNVKQIQYAQLEDFIESLTCGNKTKHNYLSCIHNFFSWLFIRKEISHLPSFPSVSFELGLRKTIDKETQILILDELKRISWKVNPKIWLGVKWLCTYISIRPNELRHIKESDIDLKQGLIFIPHPKEKRPKLVPLINEDIELIKTFPPSLPHLYFFRHRSGYRTTKGKQFGKGLLYKYWRKACENCGINGVDLYGGTRHSSAMALRQFATPEQIKRATMHTTNRAFERYFQISKNELQDLYSLTGNVQPMNYHIDSKNKN
ncbi:MAG: hypothetical protein CSB34_06135 [Desulfobulbus propionicus]|nr:MAG: hypothetical protein CSB34_06135 [Desulfobulbus propionicus]